MDSGTTQLLVPMSFYPTLSSVLTSGLGFTYYNGNYYGPCTNPALNSVWIAMGNVWFEVPPGSYMQQNNGAGTCLLNIVANSDETWLLGDTFLMNFYSIWDNDGGQIGLVPHRTSKASTVPTSSISLPSNVFTPTDPWTSAAQAAEFAGVIVAVLGAAGVVAAIVTVLILYEYGLLQVPLPELIGTFNDDNNYL